MSRRLRLVKVLVQPVFVLDDGENVEEIEHGAIAIPAAEWPAYSGERFPAEVAAWQAQLDAEAVPPNRAARRAKPKQA
jgi:hypothetical protein